MSSNLQVQERQTRIQYQTLIAWNLLLYARTRGGIRNTLGPNDILVLYDTATKTRRIPGLLTTYVQQFYTQVILSQWSLSLILSHGMLTRLAEYTSPSFWLQWAFAFTETGYVSYRSFRPLLQAELAHDVNKSTLTRTYPLVDPVPPVSVRTMSLWPSPPPPTKLGRSRVLSPNAGVRVSPLQLVTNGLAWEAWTKNLHSSYLTRFMRLVWVQSLIKVMPQLT